MLFFLGALFLKVWNVNPNGRLWDLVLTEKEVEEGRDEVLEIEKTLKRLRVEEK